MQVGTEDPRIVCTDLCVSTNAEEVQTPAKTDSGLKYDSKAQSNHTPLAEATSSSTSIITSIMQSVPDMCTAVFTGLGKYCPEKTYQNAFAVELELLGLKTSTVHVEYAFPEFYKGRVVGQRRADLLIILGDEKLLFEFKNAQQLNAEHMTQLQFYMHELKVQQGFLINFPKAGSFPDDHGCDFATKVLHGSVSAKALEVKPRKASDADVEVVMVTQNI